MYKTTEVKIGDRVIGYVPYDEEADRIHWPNRGVYNRYKTCERYTHMANGEHSFESIGVGKRFSHGGECYTKVDSV